jgi:uncharacterized membrane protein
MADQADVIVVLLTEIGTQLVEHEVVARVHGGGTALSEDDVLRTLVSGSERSFFQDPMLAFRLLVDIALRALSPAINDPTTAVQALDAIDGLIRPLCTRDLDVGHVAGTKGDLRVAVPLPRWEDFLELISAEITLAARSSAAVLRRLEELLTGVLELAPPARHPWSAITSRSHNGPALVLTPLSAARTATARSDDGRAHLRLAQRTT